MADTKISGLTAASVVASANEFGLNEAGASKKASADQIRTHILTAPVFAAGTSAANTAPKLTSGTLNSTAEVGALEYDGTAFYETNNTTSGRAVLPYVFVYRLAADQAAVGSTSAADFFTATSSFPTVTNGIYLLNYHLWYLKTTANTVSFTILNSQTYTNINAVRIHSVVGGIQSGGSTTLAGIDNTTTAAALLPVSGTLTDAVLHFTEVRAIVECATAGNIRLQITCQVAGTVTAQRGCYYTVQQLPSGNVGILVA